MPSSQYNQINEIIEIITRLRPKHLLDIGPGFGKYGVLAREYLELWDGRNLYADWQHRIDCIEGHDKYITSLHRYIYSNIYTGDATRILPGLETRYDLVLMIDVLEHFDQGEGLKILQYLSQRGSHILVSTPKFVNPQDDVFDNPFEIHRSEWKRKDFNSFKSRFIFRHHSFLIVLIGPRAREIGKAVIRRKRYLFLKKNFRFLRILKRALPR